MLAWIHPDQVSAYFCTSIVDLLVEDKGRTIAGYMSLSSGPNIAGARNRATGDFLNRNQADWLLWIDADMVFPAVSVERLLASADPVERPIVGGLCFSVGQDGATTPTIIREADDGGWVMGGDYPPDALVRCAATGTAFLLIHRRVLRAMRAHGFSETFTWFQETERNGHYMAEDQTFCVRAGDLGFPVHVNTGVVIGHHKSRVFGPERATTELTPW